MAYLINNFETKDRRANLSGGYNGYYIATVYKKHPVLGHDLKHLATYQIKSDMGAKSYTALLRACKDPSNQFCPQPVQADNPPPASSHPTAGGNLLHSIQVKNNSIKFFPSGGSVTAVIELYGDKYTYHLPFDAYYKIKRLNEDCKKLNGYPMGIKRCLKLCKKLCYDANNERYSVA